MSKKNLLFLFSDTGGGHRSSMEAVEEAFYQLYPNQFEIEKVDFLKYYAPWPFCKLADWYPKMLIGNGFFWQAGFNILNNSKSCLLLLEILWPYVKRSIQKLFLDHPSNLIVSFHPLINYYLKKLNLKHALVITDLVTAHTFWYLGSPQIVFAPTQPIVDTGIKLGLSPSLFQITGLPINLKFKPKPPQSSPPHHLVTVLLMGGGQGMGKLLPIARALNHSGLPLSLIVVAGRNLQLKSKLNRLNWQIPVEIFGFTKEIPLLMQKSDVLVTKAGPSTICEGLVSDLPIFIYDYLKGQETKNVDYVIQNQAGFYCPNANALITSLKLFLDSKSQISTTIKHVKLLAKPQAALDIARSLYKLVS